MLDVVHAGFAFGHDARQHQRRAGAQVGGGHISALQVVDAAHKRMMVLDGDVAPMRASSLANMKRFSKTFSVTMEVPWAKLHSSMN